jgi:hypothetical protein
MSRPGRRRRRGPAPRGAFAALHRSRTERPGAHDPSRLLVERRAGAEGAEPGMSRRGKGGARQKSPAAPLLAHRDSPPIVAVSGEGSGQMFRATHLRLLGAWWGVGGGAEHERAPAARAGPTPSGTPRSG